MTNSAQFGDPPANAHDADLILGIYGTTEPPTPVVLPNPHAVSQAQGLVIGLSFAIAFVIIITGGRLATRICRRCQVFGLDDWVIIPAALLVIAYLANILARVDYACAGKHINYCTYAELGLFLELGAIDQIIFYAAVTLVKISMVLFNRRLTGLSSRPWQIVHYVFLGFLICWFFITFFVNLFQCRPVTGFFNFATQARSPNYRCLNSPEISNAFSIINATTDFMLLCVPIIVLWRVQMNRGRKIRIMLLFCVGIVCCAASVIRFTYGYRHTKDITWIFVQEIAWTIVDITFSAIVASLPALNALIETSVSKMGSTIRSNSRPTEDTEKMFGSTNGFTRKASIFSNTRSNSTVEPKPFEMYSPQVKYPENVKMPKSWDAEDSRYV